ncbi:T9SS C-terminal target domain-containing protein, partial [Kordia jejudonensis]|uniref:T9SS C-terminal target domain-containing protein n=1 Tax=Kordia jejudonensis TaxID=1348245 RepID=UPI000629193C
NGDGIADDDEDTAVVVPQLADLSIVKAIDNSSPNVGDTVTFTLTVTNAGPDIATNVAVEDILPIGYTLTDVIGTGANVPFTGNTASWSGITIPANNGEVVLTYTATVNTPTGAAGEYTNSAQITASDQYDPDSTVNNNVSNEDDQDEVTIVPNQADLSLTKVVVDGDTTPLVGSEITFQITVTNDGPSDATGVEVTDLLPSGYDFVLFSSTSGAYNETTGVWNIGAIMNGTSETLLIDVLVNATGDYNNIAQITDSDVLDIDSIPNNDDGDQSEDDEDNAVVTPVQIVTDLSLTKIVVDGDTTPLVGSEITFEITVTNDGPQDATGIEVTDLLPSGYDFVLYSSTTGSYDETTGLWTIGNMQNGATETLLIDVLVNASGDYLNVAQVTAADILDIDSAPNNDDGDQSEDDEDNASVTPVQVVTDLSLTKTVVDNDITPLVGSEITFEITVTNDGPQDATGIEVTDLLPSGYDFVLYSSTTGSYDETTGLWTIGNMPNGATETLLIDVLVNASGDYNNIAQVTAADIFDIDSTPNNDNGDQSEDDEDNAIVTPVQMVTDLSLTKTVVDGDTTPLVGSEITFEITVTNDGPQDATGIEVTDLLPSGYDFVLYSSTTGSYDEITGLWTIGNIPNGATETLLIDVLVNATGDYNNIAQVTAADIADIDSAPNNDNGDQSEDDEDNAVVTPVDAMADLSLSKTVENNLVTPNAGDQITFVITVSNAGPNDATGVEVVDLLPAGFDFVQYNSTSGVYDETTGLWTVGTVQNGFTESLFIEVIVNQPSGVVDEYLNIAQITASDIEDPNSDPNNDDGDQSEDDEDNVLIMTETADLSLAKTVSNINANVGEVITFTLTVSNAGSVGATGVEVEDVLPIGYSNITNISNGGILTGNIITWTGLNIPLTGLTLTYDVTVNMPTFATDEYLNIAQITRSDQFDPNSQPANDDGDQSQDDEDAISITTPSTDLEVLKAVSNTNPVIGDNIIFTITVTNLGGLNATAVEIMDILPTGYEFISADTSSGTYDISSGLWQIPLVATSTSQTLSMTVKVLDVNDYLNVASLTGLDQVDANNDNDNAEATIDPQCLGIYNEFSPNGDGTNEFFTIDCISNYPNNTLEIYNRWGNIVYSKKGYNNTFDGTSNGRATIYKEEKLPVGTYYYILDLGDGSRKRAGWLYINR